MKLVGVRLKNYRGFRDSGRISIGDMTAFVGENDAGKSSVLEALDVFFNEKKADVQLSDSDFNVAAREASETVLEIRCFLSPDPEDSGKGRLSLKKENLLNAAGELEIAKRFHLSGNGLSLTPETMLIVVRRHVVSDSNGGAGRCLLSLASDELRRFCSNKDIQVPLKATAGELREAIRKAGACKTERSSEHPFELNMKEDVVSVVAQGVSSLLPVFHLFRADRENDDSEDEVQHPIKIAVRDCLDGNEKIRSLLEEAAHLVSKSLADLLERTCRKIGEFDSSAIGALKPLIPPTAELRWADVFKGVALQCSDRIAVNRRGSGVKRLVLLGFFKARAESPENGGRTVIFAIEEPETAQHFGHQRQLTDVLRKLAMRNGTQVLLTTHSPVVVSRLSLGNVRAVRCKNGVPSVEMIDGRLLLVPRRTAPSGEVEVSMNEVNYLVFGECRSEYHDELFGYLDETYGTGKDHTLKLLRKGRPVGQSKIWNRKGKSPGREDHSFSYYIRNYVHHPESRGPDNPPPTEEEWKQSIAFMRAVIENGGAYPTNN